MQRFLQITYGHPFVLKRRSKILKSRKLKPHMIYGYSSTFLHHNYFLHDCNVDRKSCTQGNRENFTPNFHILVTNYKTITDLAVFQ